jgi:hypothetical protein
MRNWNGLRIGARILVLPWFFVIVLGPLAAMVADAGHMTGGNHLQRKSYTAEFLAARLARVLPGHPLILMAGTLVALGALYWLVQRQFERADRLPLTQTRVA